MKAVYLNEPGGPEALIYGDLPDPTPGPGEILVRMRAAGVNHVDTIRRSGVRTYFKLTPPHILGVEFAGEVAALGAGVTTHKIGDRVFGRPVHGTYAELAVAKANAMFRLPDEVSFEDGAGLGTTLPEAWTALIRRAKIVAGEAVLITAGASGTGAVMIQLAKAAGCFVIATAGGEQKLGFARQAGADAVIDHYKEDVAARIKEVTNGRGLDVAVDATCSTPLFNAMIDALRPGGRLVIYGNMASPELTMNVRNVFFRGLQLIGGQGGDPDELAAQRDADVVGMLRLVSAGKVRIMKDRVLPLAKAAEAHRLLEKHAAVGKIILTPT